LREAHPGIFRITPMNILVIGASRGIGLEFVRQYRAAGDRVIATARDDFDRVMRTNVWGAMQAIPQVAPLVAAAGGKFVFVSSRMGRIADVESSYSWVYRASKAALNMAVASAQPDYPQALMVAISPGWVQTDMGGAGAPLTVQESVASMRKSIAALSPADRGAFIDHDGRPFAGW
jgi:NAD(P)-dependent dehydrogenase (short-subunit alcohol dehydrogenase family)